MWECSNRRLLFQGCSFFVLDLEKYELLKSQMLAWSCSGPRASMWFTMFSELLRRNDALAFANSCPNIQRTLRCSNRRFLVQGRSFLLFDVSKNEPLTSQLLVLICSKPRAPELPKGSIPNQRILISKPNRRFPVLICLQFVAGVCKNKQLKSQMPVRICSKPWGRSLPTGNTPNHRILVQVGFLMFA